MASELADHERRLRHLLGSFILATAASVALLFFGAETIDLDAIVPWAPEPTVGAEGEAQATAIVLALPVIAALPLVFRGSRRQLSMAAFWLMSLFVIVSIIGVGILYLPSAWMLGLASSIRPSSNSESMAK